MAKRGTFHGAVERGWARFRKLPLVAKGPIIAVTVLVVLGIIGAIMRAGETKKGTTIAPTTVAETAVATATVTARAPTVEPTATPPSPTPVPSPTPLVSSSRGSPLPIGTSAMVGVWSVKVSFVRRNATPDVLAADRSNGPPAPGQQFFMVGISATYLGDGEQASLSPDLLFAPIGAANVAYQPSDGCGVILDPLDDLREVPRGQTTSGNLCWSVKSSDLESLLLSVTVILSQDGQRAWFALR
jgi:hypothetical protein